MPAGARVSPYLPLARPMRMGDGIEAGWRATTEVGSFGGDPGREGAPWPALGPAAARQARRRDRPRAPPYPASFSPSQ